MDDSVIHFQIFKKQDQRPCFYRLMNYLAILRSIQEYEQVVQCMTFRCHTMILTLTNCLPSTSRTLV